MPRAWDSNVNARPEATNGGPIGTGAVSPFRSMADATSARLFSTGFQDNWKSAWTTSES